jgi:RNA polymerase sigma-70 factor (ECF subfamily)
VRSCRSHANRAPPRTHADAAEDIVQDALLTIHRVRHNICPPPSAAVAARDRARPAAIDAARRRGRTASRETHNPVAYETFADASAKRSEQAAQSADEIGRMMGGLTPRQKEAVELVKLKEMSLAEASAASGQSVGSLKVNVHRAIQRMRHALARGDGESQE